MERCEDDGVHVFQGVLPADPAVRDAVQLVAARPVPKSDLLAEALGAPLVNAPLADPAKVLGHATRRHREVGVAAQDRHAVPLLGAALRQRRAEAARAAGEDELERGRALRTDGEECERAMHGCACTCSTRSTAVDLQVCSQTCRLEDTLV